MVMIMIGIIFKDREYHPKDYNDLESFYMMDSLSDRDRDWPPDRLRWNEAHPDKPVQRGHRRNLRFHHEKPQQKRGEIEIPDMVN
jgi:hypothetical protein